MTKFVEYHLFYDTIISNKIAGGYLMDKLQELLDEFEEKIKKEDLKNVDKDDPNGQYNFCIPKIKNYFIPFIWENLQEINYIGREEQFFQSVFNREYLIEATIFYVETAKTRGVYDDSKTKRCNSINDFLIAFGKFYELVLKNKFRMMSVHTYLPATEELVADIRMRLEKKGYVLLEAEEFPAIQSEEYDFVKKYFESINSLSDKQLQSYIIIQLTFLYGLSFSTIRNIHTRDVDLEKRTLKILSKDKKDYIILELPYSIFKNMNKHISQNSLDNDELIFFTKEKRKNDTPIASSFLKDVLTRVKDLYAEQYNCNEIVLKRFTHSGMIKYAISNMLEANLDFATIENLTSRDIKFILSCRPYRSNSEKQSNYINMKIRATNTYYEI